MTGVWHTVAPAADRVLGTSLTSGSTPSRIPAATASPLVTASPLPAAALPSADGSAAGSADGAPQAVTSSPEVPRTGDGVLTPVDVPGSGVPPAGRAVRYSVEVEGGLGVDPAVVAGTIRDVLLSPRGWQKEDGVSFRPVGAAQVRAGAAVDIRVTVASPALTDTLCAPLETGGEVSCWNGERAVLNAKRWMLGAQTYSGTAQLASYRTYLINHEVGHGLGHHHTTCPSRGGPAMVMQQQTLTLEGCTPYPWPVRP